MASTKTCVKVLQLVHVCLCKGVCEWVSEWVRVLKGRLTLEVSLKVWICAIVAVATPSPLTMSWKSINVPLLRQDNEVVAWLLPTTDTQQCDISEEWDAWLDSSLPHLSPSHRYERGVGPQQDKKKKHERDFFGGWSRRKVGPKLVMGFFFSPKKYWGVSVTWQTYRIANASCSQCFLFLS